MFAKPEYIYVFLLTLFSFLSFTLLHSSLQYMRTAFQIDGDPTVRVSLDTNLCMITERVKETLSGKSWYRDPNQVVPLNQITRFPHAVLEIKLQLQDGQQPPEWVTGLINSGRLHEVHKFSKFIHGCAVLLTDDVQDVPYWIDDPTLRESILLSGGEKLLASKPAVLPPPHIIPFTETGPTQRYQVGVQGLKQRPNPAKSNVSNNKEISDFTATPADSTASDVGMTRKGVSLGTSASDARRPDYDSDDEDERTNCCTAMSETFNCDDFSCPYCHVGMCCEFGRDAVATDMSIQKVFPYYCDILMNCLF
jgi:hypothetical protein